MRAFFLDKKRTGQGSVPLLQDRDSEMLSEVFLWHALSFIGCCVRQPSVRTLLHTDEEVNQ